MSLPTYPRVSQSFWASTLCFAALALCLQPALNAQNPIVLENQNPGAVDWEIPFGRSGSDAVGQIKGYASAVSVNKGESINFHISVNPAQTYTIDVYRLGWYQGLGARLMQHIGPLNGTQQAKCPVDALTGLIECHWAVAYTLQTQSTWTSGVYMAVLTNAQNYQNYISFVVRDDTRNAALIYQQTVTTYQAYNDYPYDNVSGKSLYAFNSYGANTVGGSRAAVKVSFDRPYSGDGDCNPWGHCVLSDEFAFIRWAEKNGYDIAYSTDIDTHTNGNRLLNYRGLLSVGHDEYWTKAMFDNVVAARDAGVNLAFFTSNTAYTQIRLEPSTAGTANRVVVCYRDAALDPNTDPALETVNWRDSPLNRPEQTMMGVMYTSQVAANAQNQYAPYVVQNSGNWVYAGTGFNNGDSVPGLVGNEADRLFTEYAQAPSVNGTFTILSRSPYNDGGGTDYGNSSVYQAASGAWVFAAATIIWAEALDNYTGRNIVDARIQQTTANVLNRFIGAPQSDYSIAVSPTSQTTSPGESANYTATITRTGGFAGNITLSVSGLPSGATASFSQNPATSISTLTVTAGASTPFGTYTLHVEGVGGSVSHSSNAFTLTVSPNSPPTISSLGDQTVTVNSSTGPISFTVGDGQTAAANLTLTGSSSNTTLVPDANIFFGGSAANRTVNITPASNQTGTATITITVSDGSLTSSASFVLTVNTSGGTSNFLLNEGFEAAGFDNPGWTKNGAPNPDYTTTVLDGTQSLNCVGAQYISRNFQYGNSFYIYFQVRWNAWTDYTNVINWDDSGWNIAAGLFADNNVLTIQHGTVSATGSTQLTTNVTYHIWIEWVKGTTSNNGSMKMYVSNTANKPALPDAQITNGTGSAAARIYMGPFGAGPNVIFDKFLVAASPIGSNPGTAQNTPPTISNINDQTTPEDTATSAVPFTVGDAESQASALTVIASSSNTTLLPNANIVFGGTGVNRTVTLSPAPDQSGISTVTVTVSDGTLTATDTFLLTVDAVNDPPTIGNISDESTPKNVTTIPVPFTVADPDTSLNTLTVSGSSSNQTLVPDSNIVFGGSGGNRTATIIPATDQTGTATITITVSDGSLTANGSFVLTVTTPNTAPTITPIADQDINQNTATSALPLTVGDGETAAADLTLAGSSSNTTLVPNTNIVFGGSGTNRTVTVTPANNQSGSATINLTVSDGSLDASTSFVLRVNGPPTITKVPDNTISQDTSTTALAFTVGDTETAAASLTVSADSSNVALVPNTGIIFGGSGANRTVTVTPAAGQTGTSTITLTVTDGSLSAGSNFVLTVTPPNAAPTISDVADLTINQNTSTGALAVDVGDSETPAANLTLTGSSSNTALVPNGNIVFGGTGANRTVTVTPAANQGGSATITLTVSDGSLTASSNFVLTVNRPPTISTVANTTIDQDTSSAPLAFTVGDDETPVANLVVTGSSSASALIPDANIALGGSGANRTVVLTPAIGQTGTATVTLAVSDGALSSSSSFLLTVVVPNTAPTISAIPDQTTNEDTSLGPLAFTINDAQTQETLTVSASSSNTTLVPNANLTLAGSGTNRTLTVTPVANQSGTSSITVTVSDGSLTTSTTFVLTVAPVNDGPTISGIANRSIIQNTNTGAIAFTVTDVDTALTSLTLTGSSSNQTLVPDSNIVFGGSGGSRTVTVTPATNQSGAATIMVTVSDGQLTASTSFLLTVTSGNTPPTITTIADQTISEDGTTGALAFTIGDAQTSASSLTLTRVSSNTTLVPTANITFGGSGANRTVTVKPAANRSGVVSVTITVSDGSLSTAMSFNVTVNPVNDRPTITSITNQIMARNTTSSPITFTVDDIDNPASMLTVTGTSSSTTLVPNTSIVFGGADSVRNLTITPAPNQTGNATITVTVNDGALTASTSFTLAVTATGVPTYKLNEAFEGAGYQNTGWTASGTPNPDYITTVLDGSESLNTPGGSYVWRNFSSTSSFNIYFQIQWNVLATNKPILTFDTSSYAAAAGIWVGSTNRLYITHGTVSANGTTVIDPNTQYHVWVEWKKNTSGTGVIKLYLSTTTTKPDVPEIMITNGRGSNIARMYVGSASAGPDMIFDRMLISDYAIGSNP